MDLDYKARQTTLNRLVQLKLILSDQLASAADVLRLNKKPSLRPISTIRISRRLTR